MDRDTIKRRLSRVAILSSQADAIADEVEKIVADDLAEQLSELQRIHNPFDYRNEPEHGELELGWGNVDGTNLRRLTICLKDSATDEEIADGIVQALLSDDAPNGVSLAIKKIGVDEFRAGYEEGSLANPDQDPFEESAAAGSVDGIPLSLFMKNFTDGARAGRDEVLKHLRDKADGMNGGPIKGALAKIAESVETWPLPQPEFAELPDEQPQETAAE